MKASMSEQQMRKCLILVYFNSHGTWFVFRRVLVGGYASCKLGRFMFCLCLVHLNRLYVCSDDIYATLLLEV
jgi:hypothetical protein